MDLISVPVHEAAIDGANRGHDAPNLISLPNGLLRNVATVPERAREFGLDQPWRNPGDSDPILHKSILHPLNHVFESRLGGAVDAEHVVWILARDRGNDANIGARSSLSQQFDRLLHQEESRLHIQVPHFVVGPFRNVHLVPKVGRAGSVWHKHVKLAVLVLDHLHELRSVSLIAYVHHHSFDSAMTLLFLNGLLDGSNCSVDIGLLTRTDDDLCTFLGHSSRDGQANSCSGRSHKTHFPFVPATAIN